jgi:hypothetical protein
VSDTLTMTRERFGGTDYAGVRLLVLETEDEEEVLSAWGHVDRDALEAAERERWKVAGWTDVDLADMPPLVERVEHVWAIESGRRHADDGGQWVIDWQGVTAETPGAFPITLATPG